jgi:hypothetical protein
LKELGAVLCTAPFFYGFEKTRSERRVARPQI